MTRNKMWLTKKAQNSPSPSYPPLPSSPLLPSSPPPKYIKIPYDTFFLNHPLYCEPLILIVNHWIVRLSWSSKLLVRKIQNLLCRHCKGHSLMLRLVNHTLCLHQLYGITVVRHYSCTVIQSVYTCTAFCCY